MDMLIKDEKETSYFTTHKERNHTRPRVFNTLLPDSALCKLLLLFFGELFMISILRIFFSQALLHFARE